MAVQRIRQGLRALLAFAYEVDYPLAGQYLNDKQMTLFSKMARSEQLHSLNVLRDVLAQAHDEHDTPHDLAVAALMHDVGKSRAKMAVWQKTISVLVKKFLPALSDKFSAEDNLTVWNAPFVVRRWHPKWSADLLQDADTSECVLWLVRHHADDARMWSDHPYHTLLLRLKAADDAN